jgi:ubiquitin-conjugating enzyme E2 Z
MSQRATRRLMKDVQEFNKYPIDGCAIYQNPDNLFEIWVAIAGPMDSAYENGMYFYKFVFPLTYPNEPPHGTFMNYQNVSTRMHPNMYTNGKLCLSILGTWSGPSWTSAMSLSLIIHTIQSIMDEDPLKNEPGYNKKSPDHTKYHRIIQYHNYKDFVIKTLFATLNKPSIIFPLEIQQFDNHIISYYTKHHESILANLEKLMKLFPNPEDLHVSYQNTQSRLDYKSIMDTYMAVHQQLLDKTKEQSL